VNIDAKIASKIIENWIKQYFKRSTIKWNLSQGNKDVWKKLKNKIHMIILIDTGKAFDKIQHPFMIKKKKKLSR